MLIPLGDDLEKPDMPFVTIGLIVACLIVHIYFFRLTMQQVQTGEPLAEEFVMAWGVIPAKVPLGDFVKLGTHMFLHGDWFHIIGNMLMLWVFAHSLEAGLGSVRFLVLYLVAGLAGGYLHTVMNPEETIPMIGASGAVFGVIGAYMIAFGAMANMNALLIMGPVRHRFSMPAGAYVFFWVLLEQMLGLVIEEDIGGTGTAWYAHVGGFAAGAGSMFFLKDFVKSRMVMNKDGNLAFVDTLAARRGVPATVPDGTVEASAAAAENEQGQPTQCPHCKTVLEEAHRLADELYRCPNVNCKRLVYPTRLTTSNIR